MIFCHSQVDFRYHMCMEGWMCICPMKKGSLVSIIVHQGKIIVPFGNDHIEENDHVVIISVESGISDLNEVLYK